jgi:hypothetical protein
MSAYTDGTGLPSHEVLVITDLAGLGTQRRWRLPLPMPQPDGTQRAIAVLLFPPSMRGTGEGHRPFDFLPQSTMTNATVAGVAASPEGRRLRVTYPGGEQTIVVPPEAPIFSLKPGTRDLLAQGAQVSLTAQLVDDKPTATRISAGRNGFAPPY